nr:MAG TPA: hypothetical protein [Caudoviricetes sp.]
MKNLHHLELKRNNLIYGNDKLLSEFITTFI